MRSLRLGCALFALAAGTAVYAQETTGTIRGQVVDDAGTGVANATVEILHTPSGTRTVQTTDTGGNFNASGLRLGGPFSVVVNSAGYESATTSVPNLAAAAPQRLDVALAPEGQTITVTGTRLRSSIAIATGPAISLDRTEIAGVASINRDIRDLARRDPLVTLDPTNSRAISIAGQNNRFNRITVDGVLFGDPFGLNNGGLASARGPIPLDAICEFTVEVAPVDIRQGNFQGGAINTQLCSGTNEYHAQGFYTYSSDSLAGDKTKPTPGNPTGDVVRDFSTKAFGGQITGPLIKDRLFLAITYEGQRNSVPALVGITGEGFSSSIPNLTRAQVDNISSIAQTVYGYDTLDVASAVPEKDDKIVAKLDLNITEGHRASFTFGYNKGNLLAGNTAQSTLSSTNPTLSLQSNNYQQGDENYFGVFQLNDQWTDTFSTQARVSYQDYTRLQVPYNGRTFGQFTVCLDPGTAAAPLVGTTTSCTANTPQLQFGPDASRQANELNSQLLNIELQAQIKTGGHAIQFIAERHEQDIYNLFQQNVSGVFYFDSIAALQARYASSLTYNIPLNGDINSGAAIFDNNSYVFGIQDTWDINDDLTVLYGFRYDLLEANDVPPLNASFVARAGFRNNATLNGRGLFQPRFGFNFRATDTLRFSGSAGIIGGGNPNVWISNSYANPGTAFTQYSNIQRTSATAFNTVVPAAIASAVLTGVTGGEGIPSVIDQYAAGIGPSQVSVVNALDPNFKIPSQWRLALKGDYELDLGSFGGSGWGLGFDAIYSKVRDGTTWTDLRSIRNVVNGTLPDGRPRYQQRPNTAGTAGANAADTNQDVLLFNSKKGYSYNLVGRVAKSFDFGLDINASYTWQRSKDVNSGTSSVAGSNYSQTASLDPNQSAYGTSNYQIDNSIKLGVGYKHNFFADAATRFDLFFESRAGQRYSFTMQDPVAGRSPVFGTVGTNNRYLFYVPTSATDPLVTFAATGTTQTAAQASALLEQIIAGSKLANYRGQIAPKNVGRSPRFNKLDLHISQEIPFVFKSRVELFGDIENVLNLVNKDWGSLRQVAFSYYGTVANVACNNGNSLGTACTQYVYSNVRNPALTSDNVSLWQIRLGARFKF